MPFDDDTPLLEKLKDGWWIVRQQGGLVYTTNDGRKIVVPEGFKTNLASTPWVVWWFLPRDGDYAPAAIVHDWLYTVKEIEGKPITKSEADAIMSEASEAVGVGCVRRGAIWSGLWLGGWWAWHKTRENQA